MKIYTYTHTNIYKWIHFYELARSNFQILHEMTFMEAHKKCFY